MHEFIACEISLRPLCKYLLSETKPSWPLHSSFLFDHPDALVAKDASSVLVKNSYSGGSKMVSNLICRDDSSER